jgi:hypothetical protein
MSEYNRSDQVLSPSRLPGNAKYNNVLQEAGANMILRDDIIDEMSEREDSVMDPKSASKRAPIKGNFSL